MNYLEIILAYNNGIGQRSNGRPVIAFYGVLIVLGFLMALLVSNYRAHKDGFNWDFFSFPIMLPVLLSAIVGCRIWYVVASFDSNFLPTFQKEGFWKGVGNILNVANGGLAVQGGVLLSVFTGVVLCLKYRKGMSILHITDYMVPTIFIGQTIGRWGNFFNQEVVGHAVTFNAWTFLPNFILNNMHNNGERLLSGVKLPDNSIAVPLFLIEGVLNMLMFVLIAFALPRVFKKTYKDGDSSFAYFVGYGIVRLLLEQLRHPWFIMGKDNNMKNSESMAVIFIVFGIVAIIFNHIEINRIHKINRVLQLIKKE